MANPIYDNPPDQCIKTAIEEALKAPNKDGEVSYVQATKLVRHCVLRDFKSKRMTDVQFRDLKKILRTKPLSKLAIQMIESAFALYYPLDGPWVYPGEVEGLEGKDRYGNMQCAALVQHTTTPRIGLAANWREGMRVKGNSHLIKKGTAVATFEDGFYPNRNEDNHVAYYISEENNGIRVMDQWYNARDDRKPKIGSRVMKFLGQYRDGSYKRPSDNGDALSVIMRKA